MNNDVSIYISEIALRMDKGNFCLLKLLINHRKLDAYKIITVITKIIYENENVGEIQS